MIKKLCNKLFEDNSTCIVKEDMNGTLELYNDSLKSVKFRACADYSYHKVRLKIEIDGRLWHSSELDDSDLQDICHLRTALRDIEYSRQETVSVAQKSKINLFLADFKK